MADIYGGSSPVSTSNPDLDQITNSGRELAAFIIKFNGVDLADKGLDLLVRRIKVEEILNSISRVYIEMVNSNGLLDNSNLLKEGAEIEVYLGWAGVDIVNLGKFIADDPVYDYHPDKGHILSIMGFNKVRILSQGGDKRRSFVKRKDSEIVELIAKEYGLKAEVKDTKVTYDLVVQANQNDYEFILDRADLYGYVVYIDKDTLHFHPLKYEHTNKSISYRGDYLEGSTSPILRLKTNTKLFLAARNVKKDQLDWQTLDIYKTSDKNEQDEITKSSKDTKKILASDAVSTRAISYLIGSGHLQDYTELDRQTEAFSKSSRWICSVNAVAIGLEFIKVGKVLNFQTDLKYSGEYLITECEHSYDCMKTGISEYSTSFKLIRTYTRDIETDTKFTNAEDKNSDITSDLSSGGLVGIA